MNRRGTILMIVLCTILVFFSTAFNNNTQAQANPNNDELAALTLQTQELIVAKDALSQDNKSFKEVNEQVATLIPEFESEIEKTEKQLETAKESKAVSVSKQPEVIVKGPALAVKSAALNNKQEVAKPKSMAQTSTQPVEVDNGGDWMNFTASFYNAGAASTGKQPGDKQYGITRSGNPVTPGVTVSVDPKVIPLGSWIEIKYSNGTIEKRRADDTGGAIRGHKIDVFKQVSDSELLELGVMRVQVRIVSSH